jgi:hypothetical protein
MFPANFTFRYSFNLCSSLLEEPTLHTHAKQLSKLFGVSGFQRFEKQDGMINSFCTEKKQAYL